ncbi:MAG: hypothetical protein WBY94_25815 [Polyangiaceae bacterium]
MSTQPSSKRRPAAGLKPKSLRCVAELRNGGEGSLHATRRYGAAGADKIPASGALEQRRREANDVLERREEELRNADVRTKKALHP